MLNDFRQKMLGLFNLQKVHVFIKNNLGFFIMIEDFVYKNDY